MKKLPKRHNNHKQETESVRVFQSLIPSDWVYRIPSDDYGVDGEVEIFDSDGYATGKKFYVQLKATAQKDKSKALKLSLPIKSANYFQKLNLPVLIVRYLSNYHQVYMRWFHSFDEGSENVTEKSLVMKFDDSHLWNDFSGERLERVVTEYRELDNGPAALPIELSLYVSDESVLGQKALSFITEFSSRLNDYTQIAKVRFVTDENEYSSSYIKIDNSKLVIVVAEKTFFTLKIESDTKLPDSFLNDVMVGLGVTLYQMGMVNQASAFLHENLPKSKLKQHIEICSAALNSTILTHNITDFLTLTEALFDEEETYDAGQLAFAILLKCEKSVLNEHLDEISGVMETISKKLLDNSIPILASIVDYNHANLLRSHPNKFKKAIKFYNRANKLSDRYQNKSYWYSEVAGCLFMLNRYKSAAMFYEKSNQLNFDTKTLVLLADSLFLSGHFKESLDCFHDYFDRVSDEEFIAEWRLKSLCLHMIVDNLGVENNMSAARFIMEDQTNEDDIAEFLKNKNTLSFDAWYELAIIKADQKDYEDATWMFLIASIIKSHDINSLSNALRCSFKAEDPRVTGSIFQYGYEIWKEDFFTYFLENTPHSDDSAKMQKVFMELLNHLREKGQPVDVELRFHDQHGGVQVFNPSDNTN